MSWWHPGGRAWSQYPQRAVIAQYRVGVNDRIGQFVLIIAVTPPYDDAVHSGVVVLVHEILARELFNLGTNGIVHVVVPEPLLDDIAGLETKFFSVL